MKARSAPRVSNRIDRSAVDALLYGTAKGLAYLGGEDERLLLKEMGRHMLDYLVDVGRVKSPRNRREFRSSLRALLTKNGFGGEPTLEFDGAGSSPAMPGLVEYLSETSGLGRRMGPAQLPQTKDAAPRRVDWVLYEAMLYGLTRSLDFLGAQGQILINRIGAEMLNFLMGTGKVAPSDDMRVLLQEEKDYFIKAGFAVSFDAKMGENMRGGVLEFTYVGSRYHMNVLTRLRSEGSVLYSCPPCVIACSIWREHGWTLQFDGGYQKLRGGKVVLRHKLTPPGETFTEDPT